MINGIDSIPHLRGAPPMTEVPARSADLAANPSPASRRWHLPRSASVAAGAFAAVLLAVEAVIVAESWRGLVGFAGLIGIHHVAAWGVPITLDGVSLVAALIALRAELAGESSGIYRLTLFAFTGASAAANYWHGRHAGGTEAALYLGGMSLAVAWVFALVLRQIRHEDRRRAGRVTDRLPKFSAAHWTRYPGLTWRAWSLAVRDGHTEARAALDAANAAELPMLAIDADTLAAMSVRDRLAVAFGVIGALDVPRALALLAEHGCAPDQSHAYQVRRSLLESANGRPAGGEST
jgi:Protein of unknown function (DUF2637)